MNERTLEFEVIKQRLKKKRGCDFTGLVSGSVNYLRAKFYFSEEWTDCVKIATFETQNDSRVSISIQLDENDSCIVPGEIAKAERFTVSVLGGTTDYKICTGTTKVKQKVVN